MASSGSADVFSFTDYEKQTLMNLYKKDIEVVLKQQSFSMLLVQFSSCFHENDFKRIVEARVTNEDACVNEIVKTLTSPSQEKFLHVVEALNSLDSKLATKLRCNQVQDIFHYRMWIKAYFSVKLAMTEEYLPLLIQLCIEINLTSKEACETILQNLKCNNSVTYDIVSEAVDVLYKNIVYSDKDWYWKLTKILESHSTGSQIINLVNHNHRTELHSKRIEEVLPRSACVVVPIGQSVRTCFTGAAGDNPLRSTIDENMKPDITPRVDEPNYELHEFQKYLVSEAITGKNTVICAPTGSGKTYMAVAIIDRCLRQNFRNDGRKPKAMLVVPTVALVDQQTNTLKKTLPPSVKVAGIKGGATSAAAKLPKKLYLSSNDVIVTTPQILVNLLLETQEDNRVSLSMFTLLIFDECHHTSKNHPYSSIMVEYMDALFTRPNPQLPQIIGLTASLGVDKAENLEQAVDHILRYCAHMNADGLMTINEEHKGELNYFVNCPQDHFIRIRQPLDPLATIICRTMITIENVVGRDFALLGADKEAKLNKTMQMSITAPENKAKPDYMTWVANWLQRAPKFTNSLVKRQLVASLEQLRVYHEALDINAHVPCDQAIEYLNRRFDEFRRKAGDDRDKYLVGLYDNDIKKLVESSPAMFQVKNMLAEALKNHLVTGFQETPNGRALVFTRTRDLTIALEAFFNKDPSLKPLNVGRLTGANASSRIGGLTATQQQDVLARFRTGAHRVLIATTIAEEGLDIAECNLVIKYNHVSNEIAMIQRRGRGRAAGSKSVLLAREEWIEDKEHLNVLRATLMDTAVESVKKMDRTLFKHRLQKIQRGQFDERNLERVTRQRAHRLMANKEYNMLCKKCDSFLVNTKNMRKFNESHYVAVDASVWERLCAEPNAAPMVFETMISAGKVSCKNCRNECGSVIRYRRVYFANISVGSTLLNITGNSEKLVCRKWSQALKQYFAVDQLTTQDLYTMHKALPSGMATKLQEAIGSILSHDEEMMDTL